MTCKGKPNISLHYMDRYFPTACGSVIERVFPLHQKLGSWNLGSYLPVLQFSTFQQFQFSSHIFTSVKAFSQWTTALFRTNPESCPSHCYEHDRLIWKIACNPAEVFGFFLLLMQLPVTSVGFKIVSEMLSTNSCLGYFLLEMLNIRKNNLLQNQVLDSWSNISMCLCHWFEMEDYWE